MTIKRYFKNIMSAFMGGNPFQEDLEQANDKCVKLEKKVSEISEIYEQSNSKLTKLSKCINDYQKLIENLRQRIMEKDDLLRRTKEEYQRRIADYNNKIDELQCQLRQK